VSAGETALVLFGVVLGFGLLVVSIVLGVVRLVDRESRRIDAVDAAYEQNAALLKPSCACPVCQLPDADIRRAHKAIDRADRARPPISPGRSDG
jgi:hypothetical protein